VRVGNAAFQQLQLDIFGEIADAMFQALKRGMKPSERGLALQPVIMEYLAKAWRAPDEGIWETRRMLHRTKGISTQRSGGEQ
jgi:GH15 family glucan-1,4-alpha-glucosidase